MGLFNRRSDRMNPEPADLAGARKTETNRQHLIATDPDAATILTTNAIDAAHSWKASDRFTDEFTRYGEIKRAKNQGHLYHQLFRGVGSAK